MNLKNQNQVALKQDAAPPQPAGRRGKNVRRRPALRILVLVSLCLSLSLLLSSCGMVFRVAEEMLTRMADYDASGSTPQSLPDVDYPSRPGGEEWRTIPYADMAYARPDVEGIISELEKMTEQVRDAPHFDAVLGWDWEANSLVEEFYTMHNLAEIRKYMDTADSYYDEEYRFCADAAVDVGNAASDFNEAVIEGPFAEDYRKEVGDYVFESIKSDLMLSSDEVKDYQKERNSLKADYNQKLSSLAVTHEGREYTFDDINEVESYDLYIALRHAYFRENAPWFTETYARMIELDKLMADKLGFASATEMYYQRYSRDYTPAQAEEFFAKSKEVFAPILPQVLAGGGSGAVLDYAETFERLPALMGAIDPELAEVWNGMMEYGLCDYAPADGKQSGIGFTTRLYSYDASFCYGYWEDDPRSMFTAIHEFGHYYENWLHMEEDMVQNLDLAEIYSQGLEVLSFPYIGHLTADADAVVKENLSDMLQALTFQPLLEEFQFRMYEMDGFTAEQAGQVFAGLLEEYGFSDYVFSDEDGADYSWFLYTHLFDAPFYTISYATSACVALQLWARSEYDPDGAVEAYLELIRADQNRPFLQMLADADLQSPFNEDLLWEIERMYANTFYLR